MKRRSISDSLVEEGMLMHSIPKQSRVKDRREVRKGGLAVKLPQGRPNSL